MQFCGNPNCDNEATEIAFVSESKDKVTKRPLCSTCYEAYLSGCKHCGLHVKAGCIRNCFRQETLLYRFRGAKFIFRFYPVLPF